MDAARLAKQLGRVRLAPRGQVMPSPLPTERTMAERRIIAMLPDEAEAYLERLARESAPPPSDAEIASLELLLNRAI